MRSVALALVLAALSICVAGCGNSGSGSISGRGEGPPPDCSPPDGGTQCSCPGVTVGFLGCAETFTCRSDGTWAPYDAACLTSTAADASDGSVVDVAEAGVADASVCQESLDAWCAMPSTGCNHDWSSAVTTTPYGGCWGWSVGACGGYNVLSWQGTDGSEARYYDKMSGQLVAIVHTGFQRCLEGPADFVTPVACSPSMPLCDLLGDGGTDAPSASTDSGSE